MSRKTAREVAMKLAFARLFGGEDTYEAILDKSGIAEKPTEDDMAYSNEVLAGIEEHSGELDENKGACNRLEHRPHTEGGSIRHARCHV